MSPLTIADAGNVATRARALLRAGKITAKTFAILDALLWSCRDRATGRIVASYATLCRLTHCARSTVAGALEALEGVGLLTRVRRRIKGPWHQGGSWSRQMANAFVLHPRHTEFAGRPEERRTQEICFETTAQREAAAATAALARVREGAMARMLAAWEHSRVQT